MLDSSIAQGGDSIINEPTRPTTLVAKLRLGCWVGIKKHEWTTDWEVFLPDTLEGEMYALFGGLRHLLLGNLRCASWSSDKRIFALIYTVAEKMAGLIFDNIIPDSIAFGVTEARRELRYYSSYTNPLTTEIIADAIEHFSYRYSLAHPEKQAET